MAWDVVSMQSAGPAPTKAASASLSIALDQNTDVEVNDILAICLVFDNTTATAPNVSWGGQMNGTGGPAVATPPSYIHSNSPQAASGGGVRTAMILARVTSPGAIGLLSSITFSASITAKVAAVLRIRGGDALTLANNIVSRPATDCAAAGAAFPARSLSNPSGAGDFLILNVAGVENNTTPVGLANGAITSPDGFVSANTTSGNSATNVGMQTSWRYGSAASVNYGGGTANFDASASMVMFGNAYVPPPVAPTPRVLSVAPLSSTQVNLTWPADSAALPQPVTYTIEQSLNGTDWTVLRNDWTASQSNYSPFGLTPGVLYYFRIKGTNSAGTSGYSNVVSITPTAFQIKNDMEGGQNLTQMSEFDVHPGQTPFNFYVNDNPPVYDASTVYNGFMAGRTEYIGTGGSSLFGWDMSQTVSKLYTRFYIWLNEYPTATMPFCFFYNVSGSSMGYLEFLSTGEVRLRSVGSASGAVPIPDRQWIRVEVEVDTAFDSIVARLYTSDPSAPVANWDEQIVLGTATGLTGAIKKVAYGSSAGSSDYAPIAFFDDVIAGEPGDWFGPSSAPPPPTVNAGQFGMIPIF